MISFGSITVDANPLGINQWTGKGGASKEKSSREGKADAKAAAIERMKSSIFDERGNVKLGAGFTVDAHTATDVTKGFSVALFPARSAVLDGSKLTSAKMEKEIGKWIEKNKGLLEDSRNRIKIGGWVDPKTGKVWLDAVRVYGEGHAAMAAKMGRMSNQIEIANLGAIHRGDWDHAFVNTGGTGERVKLPWGDASITRMAMDDGHPVMCVFDTSKSPAYITKILRGHLGKLAKDYNPQGVNQYTGAAVGAERASASAYEASKSASGPIGHRLAASEHAKAYTAHEKAAGLAESTKDRAAHETRALEHFNKSIWHGGRA
jgi:hypothetical protein